MFLLAEFGFWGIIYFLWNSFVPIILLFLLFRMRALGAGDIKLFSMIGSMVTFWQLLMCIKWAFLLGGVWVIFRLIIKKDNSAIPFSVAIAISCLLVLNMRSFTMP